VERPILRAGGLGNAHPRCDELAEGCGLGSAPATRGRPRGGVGQQRVESFAFDAGAGLLVGVDTRNPGDPARIQLSAGCGRIVTLGRRSRGLAQRDVRRG
jgi:hypothetical protein